MYTITKTGKRNHETQEIGNPIKVKEKRNSQNKGKTMSQTHNSSVAILESTLSRQERDKNRRTESSKKDAWVGKQQTTCTVDYSEGLLRVFSQLLGRGEYVLS